MNFPKATFCLFSFNQSKYIEEAVHGALNQDYPNLEIIISDDASTDDTFEKIERLVENYKGPHEVKLYKNNPNLGLVPHVNELVYNRATSDFFFIAAGDDVSLPNRVSTSMKFFKDHSNLMGISFAKIEIDDNGKVTNDLSNEVLEQKTSLYGNYLDSNSFMTPGFSLGFRRNKLIQFPPLNPDCPTEDSTLRFRCLLLGEFIYSGKKVMHYRWHGQNLSFGNNVFKLKTAQIVKQYLTDLEFAFSQRWINETYYKILKSKVSLYNKNRSLREQKATQNKIFSRLDHYKMSWNQKKHQIKTKAFKLQLYPKVLRNHWQQHLIQKEQKKMLELGMKKGNIVKAWWVNFPNFGDQLTPALLKYFGYTPIHVPKEEAEFICVGSLYEMIPESFDGYFLGTGFIEDGPPKVFSNATFLGVRGTFSRDRHNLPSDTLLGDPGLLSHLLLEKRSPKKFRLGIMIHHKEFNIPELKSSIDKLIQKHQDVTFISVKSYDAIEVIQQIDACENLVSSAMHGLIVADALGIPNIRAVFSDKLEGGDYKFRDYYSVFEEELEYIVINDYTHLKVEELIKSVKERDPQKLALIQQLLVKAFQNLPFKK